MRVAEGVDELSDLEVGDLRDHVREERIGGDVEGNAEEEVARALVELAREPSIRDVELEQRVTRGEGHARQVGHVPRADDQPARIRVVPDPLDHRRELVDVASVGRRPRAPLVAVDRAEVAGLVGPLVPDRDVVLVQPRDVRVAADEPDQLADDGRDVDLLRRHEREAGAQIEAHLGPEDGERPGAGAVVLADALVERLAQEIEVLLHGSIVPTESARASVVGQHHERNEAAATTGA